LKTLAKNLTIGTILSALLFLSLSFVTVLLDINSPLHDNMANWILVSRSLIIPNLWLAQCIFGWNDLLNRRHDCDLDNNYSHVFNFKED
jgi:hypothetical protein